MTAFYNKPWASGYALPAYERKENPLKRGSARTTPWLPRGTISSVPPGSKHGGYAVPKYVLKEPVGSQANTTPWLARGTVPSMKGIKTGLPWKASAHTLDSNGLGALGATNKGTASIGGGDPIESYGVKAAQVVIQEMKSIPLGKRDAAMRELLGEIDPGLYSSYKNEMGRIKDMGVPAAQAQEKGLAVAFSRGLTKEFMRLGKKGKAPTPGLRKGQVALASLTGFDSQVNNYQAVGGVWSKVKGALNKLGGLACDVATHPVTPIAAGAAGAYYGGPTGASTATAGAGVAAAACSSGGGGGGAGYAVPTSAMPSWALPAIIGGGALALILVLKK